MKIIEHLVAQGVDMRQAVIDLRDHQPAEPEKEAQLPALYSEMSARMSAVLDVLDSSGLDGVEAHHPDLGLCGLFRNPHNGLWAINFLLTVAPGRFAPVRFHYQEEDGRILPPELPANHPAPVTALHEVALLANTLLEWMLSEGEEPTNPMPESLLQLAHVELCKKLVPLCALASPGRAVERAQVPSDLVPYLPMAEASGWLRLTDEAAIWTDRGLIAIHQTLSPDSHPRASGT